MEVNTVASVGKAVAAALGAEGEATVGIVTRRYQSRHPRPPFHRVHFLLISVAIFPDLGILPPIYVAPWYKFSRG